MRRPLFDAAAKNEYRPGDQWKRVSFERTHRGCTFKQRAGVKMRLKKAMAAGRTGFDTTALLPTYHRWTDVLSVISNWDCQNVRRLFVRVYVFGGWRDAY